jgi:diguanylate cyclase (GGDEF)-like protein
MSEPAPAGDCVVSAVRGGARATRTTHRRLEAVSEGLWTLPVPSDGADVDDMDVVSGARLLRRLYAGVVLAAVAAHGLNAMLGHRGQLHSLLATPLFVAVGVVAGLSCAARSWRTPTERVPWALLTLGMASYTLGSALYFTGGAFVAGDFPSIADVLWLSLFAAAVVTTVLLGKARLGALTVEAWLDGAIVGVAATAVASTVLVPWIVDHARDRSAAMGQLTYPLVELALLGFLLASVSLRGWQPSPTQWCLLGALVTFLVVDATYAHEVGKGTYVPGTLLDTGWPLALGLVGLSARQEPTHRPALVHTRLVLSVPTVAMLGMTALLLLPDDGQWIGAALAALAMVIASARLLYTTQQTRFAEAEAREHALHDQLTGLPNRALLEDRLTHMFSRRVSDDRPAAALFIDVDNFKLINDGLGHASGDYVLQILAHRISEAVRTGDTVARISGDEFVVVCEDLHERDEAMAIARRILDGAAEPIDIDSASTTVTITVSVGVAFTPVASPEELVQRADEGMYAAKQHGRACIEVFRSDRDRRQDELRLINDLRTALSVDDDQLSVHYQPIVHLASRKPVAAEALLRWYHPTLSCISPAEFIPLAERTGVIRDLDRWMLTRVCEQISAWDAARTLPPTFLFSENVSIHDLATPDFVEFLQTLTATTGVNPRRLIVEVTETAIADDIPHIHEALAALHDAGIAIALDDFGTGFSSLSHLKRFSVDSVKIDRTFVDGITEHGNDEAIVASVINLARQIERKTVAEGIETADQLHELRELGCGYGQGFLFSRPVNAGDFPTVVRDLQAAAEQMNPPLRRTRSSSFSIDPATRARLLQMHAAGASPQTIAMALNKAGNRAPTGTPWHRNSVARAIVATPHQTATI